MGDLKEKNNTVSGGTAVLLIAAGVLIFALSGGIRANFGIIIGPLSEYTGMSYGSLSFVMGIAQLMYGLSQPFWGVLSIRKSNVYSLMCGVPLMVIGILAAPVTSNVLVQSITLGLMLGAGSGSLSFGIIMGALSPLLGRKKAAAASGILNAGSGMGGAILSPVLQAASNGIGINKTMYILAVPFFAVIPVLIWIGRVSRGIAASGDDGETAGTEGSASSISILKEALKSPDYRRLMAGFSTCGFHMIILQTHMVTQFKTYGVSDSTAAVIYTAYGVASIAGSVLVGFLCTRFPLKNVLGSLYTTRAVVATLFIFVAPKSVLTCTIFALIMGATGDATVTPTSEIISRRFGAASMGFLFGITFVCHQIGASVSSSLGGIAISSGNTVPLWITDILLCTMAAAVSYRVRTIESE